MDSERDKHIKGIIKEYDHFVRAVALKYVLFPDLAEDIAQEVFLAFYKKRDQWNLDKNVKNLLIQMTRIVSKRYWKEAKHRMGSEMQELAEHVRHLAESHHITPIVEDQTEALKKCLDKLPQRSKDLIRSRYYLNANSTEISQNIGSTPSAVRRALCRLREKLKECIAIHHEKELDATS